MQFIESDEQLFMSRPRPLKSCITFDESLAATVETEAEAQARVRDLIKELRDAQGLSYKELAARLARLGENLDARALNNRINRGSFSAGFLVLLLQALDSRSLDVTSAPSRLRAKQR